MSEWCCVLHLLTSEFENDEKSYCGLEKMAIHCLIQMQHFTLTENNEK